MRFQIPLACILFFLLVCSWAQSTEAQTVPADEIVSFKGDALGLPLAEFRKKYRRQASAPDFAPVCSDKHSSNLFVKSAESKLGEIACALTFPYEAMDREFEPPTIAEIPTLWLSKSPIGYGLLYRFLAIDSEPVLWRIDIVIPHSGYEHVREALEAKYGPTSIVESQALQNSFGAKFEGRNAAWKKTNSQVILVEFFGRKDASAAFYILESAEKVILERRKDSAKKAAEDM